MDDFFLMHWMENPNNLQMTQKNTHLLLVDSNDMKFEKKWISKNEKNDWKKIFTEPRREPRREPRPEPQPGKSIVIATAYIMCFTMLIF